MAYEALPNICFTCGMVGHGSEVCLGASTAEMDTSENGSTSKQPSGLDSKVADGAYGSWMVVERRKGKERPIGYGNGGDAGNAKGGSRFATLSGSEEDGNNRFSGDNGGEDHGNGRGMETRDSDGSDGNLVPNDTTDLKEKKMSRLKESRLIGQIRREEWLWVGPPRV